MIIDSHAHAFPLTGGPSGHPSVQEHMRCVQHLLVSHHQPVRKADDNSIVEEQMLISGVGPSLDYLRAHCDFIPPDDMDKMCGDNVAAMFARR